jgi:hypothetical protein
MLQYRTNWCERRKPKIGQFDRRTGPLHRSGLAGRRAQGQRPVATASAWPRHLLAFRHARQRALCDARRRHGIHAWCRGSRRSSSALGAAARHDDA